MYLAYSSNGRTVRVGDKVVVANKSHDGLQVVAVDKPNSKKPQGVVRLKTAANEPINVTPREIGAEWMA